MCEGKKTRVCFYKKPSGVACKVKIPGDSVKYRSGMGKNMRANNGPDFREYPLIVSYRTFFSLLSINNIKEEDVLIDPASLDIFYGHSYNNKPVYSAVLTSGYINNWWNHGCPDLIRFHVNKNRERNSWGLRPLVFENCLVSWGNTVNIDDTITEEEMKLLTKNRVHSAIYKAMECALKASSVTNEEVSEMKNFIVDYDARIQKTIDDNSLAIIMHISGMFDETGKEKSFGFNLGSLYIFTENEEYRRNKSILKHTESGSALSQDMDQKLPYLTQSITVMKKQFEKVKEVVLAETGETLFCTTLLD